jgi:hypothetical protein
MVTALAASAALLMASTASAAGLLSGIWLAEDDKNPNITSVTQVLNPLTHNEVTVAGTCVSSTFDRVRFIFDNNSRPSRTTITGTKATIDKNRKEEPAQVWAQLPGHCSIDLDRQCFEGAPFDCPGVETCLNIGALEPLKCDQGKVKSTVNVKNGIKINWQGQAKKCVGFAGPISAAVLGAIDATCGKNGENKGITINVKDTEIKNLRVTGRLKN